MSRLIRRVTLEPGEKIRDKVHATLDGVNNNGDLYLTSRRLVWVAHRVRPPITAVLGEDKVIIQLEDITACYAKSFALFVEDRERLCMFRLFRWFTPILWWKLTRRWASAINEATLLAGDEVIT